MERYNNIKKEIIQHMTVTGNTHVRSIQEYLMTKYLHASQSEISLIIQQIQIEEKTKGIREEIDKTE